MTLKEEMQKTRDEAIKKLKEDNIVQAAKEIQESLLEKQLVDKLNNYFDVTVGWVDGDLLLLDKSVKLVSGILNFDAQEKFTASLMEKVQEQEIEIIPAEESIRTWDLVIKLS